jgi:hypothetical protein
MPDTKHIAFAAFALALLVAPAAHAQEQTATPTDSEPSGELRLGKLYSFGGGTGLEHGFGMDLRYHAFPARNLDGFIGAFAQGQYELGDAWRFAGGVTGGWGFFGLELGVSHRTATATYAGSTGLHIAQYFQLGPVAVGARLTVPLVDHIPQNIASAPSVQGIEGALTVRLSFGFTVHGRSRGHSCQGAAGHGMGGGGVRDPHAQHGHP